jgi:hypothetical protein
MKKFVKKKFASCQTNFQQSVIIPTPIVDRNPRSSLAIANSSFCGGGISDPAAAGNPLAALSQGSVTMPRQPFADYTPFNGI